MQKTFEYIYKDKIYPVVVTYKYTHRIAYHFRDNKLIVYCPYMTSQKTITRGLDKFATSLIDRNVQANGMGEDYIYLLGNKVPISETGEIIFSDDSSIKYKSKEDLEKKLKKWFLALVTRRTKFYEEKMQTYENKVRVRKMSSRYGSNAIYSHSITYATILMHFSLEIIDAIVIHELAHCFVGGHQKKFYDIVYKYCPNYDALHKKLRKGEFK